MRASDPQSHFQETREPSKNPESKRCGSSKRQRKSGITKIKRNGLSSGPRKTEFRRFEKRPLMVVRVPSILKKQCWQGNGSVAALQKVKRKTMLKDRASHREKTGKLKKKKKRQKELRNS